MNDLINALNNLVNGLIGPDGSITKTFGASGPLFGPDGLFNGHHTLIDCTTNSGCSLTRAIVLSLILFFILLTGFAYTTLLERRLLSFLQQRIGPNRAGPLGFLQ